MKGFTLLEATYVILILSILFAAVFYGYALRKDFFYLKNFSKQIRLALETSIDMSQRAIFKDNYLFCGYGIYFPNSFSYEALGFYTTSTECDIVFQDEAKLSYFINSGLSKKYYLTYYNDLINNFDSRLVLADNFKGNIYFSTSSRNCDEPNRLNFPVILLSVYSTSEFYLFLGGPNWRKIAANNVYLCLEYKNENRVLRINKLGQLILEH